jgi:hypothetical protein
MFHLHRALRVARPAVFLATALAAAPGHAAILSWFGWGFSENETYKEVREWVDNTGKVLGVVGLVAQPAAAAGAVIKTTLVVADVIDPPADSFNAIVSGRITLSFDPSLRVVAAGWYGEFGADPTIPAPKTDLSDLDISLLQTHASALMKSSSIVVDQAAGRAVFSFDWGPSAYVPVNYLDNLGHFNIAGLFLEAPQPATGDVVTVVGSPADTLANGTASATYMLCTSSYCGVNPIPEPSTLVLMLAGIAVMAGTGYRWGKGVN